MGKPVTKPDHKIDITDHDQKKPDIIQRIKRSPMIDVVLIDIINHSGKLGENQKEQRQQQTGIPEMNHCFFLFHALPETHEIPRENIGEKHAEQEFGEIGNLKAGVPFRSGQSFHQQSAHMRQNIQEKENIEQ